MVPRRVVQRQGGSRAAQGSTGTVQSLRLSLLGHSQGLQTPSLQAVPKYWLRMTLESQPGTMGTGGVPLWENPQDWQCQSRDTSKDTAVMGDHGWDTPKQRAAEENQQEAAISRQNTPKAHGVTGRNHCAHNHKPPVPHRQSWNKLSTTCGENRGIWGGGMRRDLSVCVHFSFSCLNTWMKDQKFVLSIY